MRLKSVAAAISIIGLLVGGAPLARSQTPPAEVVALGGAVTMHAQAIDRIVQATGTTPTRLGGADRYASAVEVSRRANPRGADVVYVASGRDFPDALAAAPLVTREGSALLLVDPDVVPGVVATELTRLDVDRVVVLGGPAAVSDQVVTQLEQISGTPATRLAGMDRYQTAVAISRAAHPDSVGTVYVASGEQWADALAATPAVDVDDAALLLTPKNRLSPQTATELRRLAPSAVYVLGGTEAIEESVGQMIAQQTGVKPQRLAGADRYKTAQLISEHAHPGGTAVVYAATGLNWPDALAAGPALSRDDAALLLVDTTVRWGPPDLSAAIATAEAREGNISFAILGTDGTMAGYDSARPVAAASTLKVMFLTAYLRQPSVRDRDLTAEDLALLEPMITSSLNDPATTIADRLGPDPLYALAAEAGMQDFSYTRPWGNSRTSARDQARLMWHLESLLPDRHRGYALDLLTRIVPEQRWGIGQLDLPGWRAHFKGGWGSATGSVDHQVVLMQRREGTKIAVAVMTTANPSHDYATDSLRAVFADLLATLP